MKETTRTNKALMKKLRRLGRKQSYRETAASEDDRRRETHKLKRYWELHDRLHDASLGLTEPGVSKLQLQERLKTLHEAARRYGVECLRQKPLLQRYAMVLRRNPMRRRSASIAYHEAGHVVAAVLQGHEVYRVSIRRESRDELASAGIEDKLLVGVSEAVALERAAVVDYAGYFSQLRFAPNCQPYGESKSDLHKARERYVQAGMVFTPRLVETVERKTERLVTDNWGAICRLARALLNKRKLDGPKATQIVRAMVL